MRPRREGNRLLIVVGLLGALVAGFMAYIAWAQERGGPSPQRQPILIGWVDQQRLLEGFEEYKRQLEVYKQMFQRRDLALRQLGQHFLFLSEAEWNEVVQLLIKEKPTSKDKRRIEELRKLSGKREARWRELSGKASLRVEERAELQRLSEYYRSNRQRVEQLRQRWQEELQRHDQEVSSRLEKEIVEAVKKVAEQKGFDVVLYTDPPKVVYVRPELDLTDPVIEALNKAFKSKSGKK